MEKLNFEQIRAIIESKLFRKFDSHPVTWMHEQYYENAGEIFDDEEHAEFKAEYAKLGNVEMMEQFGGEGDGDQYWAVYHFKDHGVYVQFDGWYASHYGSEYNDMLEVEPVEVMRTEWQCKKTEGGKDDV